MNIANGDESPIMTTAEKTTTTTTTKTASNGSTSQQQEHHSFSLSSVILVFIVPGLADFLYGYDCGMVSYAILQIQETNITYSGIEWGYLLTYYPALQGLIVSGAALGAFIGSTTLLIYYPHASRRWELQIGSILYISGACLQSSSGIFFPKQTQQFIAITTLIIGRIVYGFGIGITMHAAPAYLSEMSPSSVRGIMISLKEAANTIGVLVGYAIGYYYYEYVNGGWKYSILVSTIFALTMLLLTFILPRSARWLVLHGKDNEAIESLQFVFTKQHAVDSTFDDIKNSIAEENIIDTSINKSYNDTTTKNNGIINGTNNNNNNNIEEEEEKPSSFTLLLDPSNRRSLITGVGIIALQQLTGSPAMLSYASTVFEESGQNSNSSVYMAMFQLLFTMITVFLVDHIGRKILLYIGCTSMTIALLVLVIYFGNDNYNNLILIAMFTFICGFQIGFGPIAWLIVAEVFSNELRGPAVALCVGTNFSTYGFVQFTVPIISSIIGFRGTFAIFGILSAYSVYFVKAYVPETKGMTLEDIEQKIMDEYDEEFETNGGLSLLEEKQALLSTNTTTNNNNKNGYGSSYA